MTNTSSGDDNTGMGYNALQANTTGTKNVALGSQALEYVATGTNNVALGYEAGSAYTSNESNNIVIGSNGVAGDGSVANHGVIRIGTVGSQTTCFIQGIYGQVTTPTGSQVFVESNGQLGTVVSSRRFKENIAPMSEESVNALCALEPVAFSYKSDTEHKKQFGLIAEQVEEVLPELVVYDQDGKPYSVAYHVLPSMLLALVQRQQKDFDAQQRLIEQQQRTLQAQDTLLRAHQKAMNDLKQEVSALKAKR